jgi:hypothetical protein
MVTLAAPAPTPNALHQRRWREREVERDAVRQALINSSYVSANEITDCDCVARALSGVIAEWVEHERPRHNP